MAESEALGWIAAAGVAGLLAGVLLSAAISSAVHSARHAREQQRELNRAAAHWLGTHRSLHRASHSLVAAFRCLQEEPVHSRNLSMREQEAQRARSDWFEARRALDRADADLAVAAGESLGRDLPPPDCRASAEALRLAIDGRAAESLRLLEQLDECEKGSREFLARLLRAGDPSWRRRSPLLRLTWAGMTGLQRLVDRWAGPPDRS